MHFLLYGKHYGPEIFLLNFGPNEQKCLCLFLPNASQICWHANLGALAGITQACAPAGKMDLMHSPSVQFAYGSSHRGAAWCQLRLTCPLQLLYVIIEPICSAQQGLDGNHEATLRRRKMEGTLPFSPQLYEVTATLTAIFEKEYLHIQIC